MAGDDARKATDAELDILNVLWRVGPSSVRDVHEAMTRLRGIRYTTTLKTLRVMTGKGLVSRDESSRAHDLPPPMYPHPELGYGCQLRFDDHRCGWPIS